MISICHPTGNANVRSVLNGLSNNNILSSFYTTISVFPGDILHKLSSINAFSELKRRSFDSTLKPFTKSTPWFEVGRLTASKIGYSSLIQHETGLFSIDSIIRKLDKKVANELKQALKLGVKGIYSYEDGAAYSFKEAKILGIQCLYDLPIGYWRAANRLLEKERELHPEWSSTIKGFHNSEMKLLRKDEELKLADRIYVASNFTAKTLKDYPGKLAPVEVIPYGFPKVDIDKKVNVSSSNKPLKLLFVGGLSQRKGIANLFAAVEDFKDHVELTVVGRKSTNDCAALDSALTKHRWIPSLSHQGVLDIMQQNDVLVFPSLFEGFGLVITEAMSQGTPVITTERTVGPDLIENNRNGWITEAGSTESLKEAIGKLISDRKLVYNAALESKQTAMSRPWDVYGLELALSVKKHFERL